MEVSLVVPAHNEEENLEQVVNRVKQALTGVDFRHDVEIVLVDDNSTDGTPELCDRLANEHGEVTVVHRTRDGGFGNAIKAGFEAASGDVLIPFMGDLSDDPTDIPKLVESIEEGYDVVYGSRFAKGGTVEGYPPLKLLYNRAYNNLIRLTFGIRARDITNAFTAYRSEVVEEIGIETLSSQSFDLTAELPLRSHIHGFTATEVPVSWRSREAGVSKLNATKKGPLYLKRLLEMFILGNMAGIGDVFKTITSERPARILGATVLGVIILFALFSLSGFEEVFTILIRADPLWVPLIAGSYFTSMLFRTWRYRVLLRTADHLASRGGVFRCIMASWFVNFTIPARAGDAVRGLALKSTEGVPFGAATGLVVVERILDMLVLGTTMLIITTVFIGTKQSNFLAIGALGIAAILAVGLLIIYYLDEHIIRIFESRFPRIKAGIEALNEAIRRTVSNPYALVLALILSIPVWLFETGTIFLSARALGVEITIIQTVTAAIAAFVSQAVPITPAGIGTYEATIAAVLALFDVGISTGTALALLDHFVRVVVVYIIGAISLVHVVFRSRSYFRDNQTGEE